MGRYPTQLSQSPPLYTECRRWGGPLFPIGVGLLSMFAALGLLAAWPTVVMLVAVVLVMLVASGGDDVLAGSPAVR